MKLKQRCHVHIKLKSSHATTMSFGTAQNSHVLCHRSLRSQYEHNYVTTYTIILVIVLSDNVRHTKT